ncbi:hypothetical protein [Methylobacterium sp. Leaf118]|uniref:hypothetical protein n=1 Tax=Methylobacterium sp. Leaf118 TaxID=2876562 RepID=UPI001E4AB0B6|nr:hypothetical protein [Methylobacterium sp. Leaf118]
MAADLARRPMTADGEPLRDEFYPPLPDIEAAIVNPAPDGRPWLKGCGECLFRTNDPQGVGVSYADSIRLNNLHAVGFFYCVHRKDGEHNRVCASYAACRAGAHHRSEKYAAALIAQTEGARHDA